MLRAALGECLTIAIAKNNSARRFMGKYPVWGKETERGIKWDQSLYYLWWQALRLSKRYEALCKANGKGGDETLREVYRDFGDIFKTDFKTWWREKGVELFAEPQSLDSVEVLDRLADYQSQVDDGRIIVVGIPTYWSKRDIKPRLQRILLKYITRKRGNKRNRAQVSKAKYPLRDCTNPAAVKRALDNYKSTEIDGKRSKVAAPGRRPENVSRDKRWAKRLIAHAEKGIFPVPRAAGKA